MKLRIEDLLASNLSLQNENQLLRNQVDNLTQSHRLEIREKDLELRKVEDDYLWRKNNYLQDSENLLKNIDLVQLENVDLKRDVDGLRALVEEKEDRLRNEQLERRKQQRILDDLNQGTSDYFCFFCLWFLLYCFDWNIFLNILKAHLY